MDVSLPSQEIIIYEVENTKLLVVPNQGDANTMIEKSTLKIVQKESEELLIRVNDFEYQIFQETPVYLTAYQTYRSYILPSIQGNYAILLHNDIPNHEEVYDCFDLILANTCNLIYNEGNKEQKIENLRKSQILLQKHSFLTPGGEDENQENLTPTGEEEVDKINSQIQKNKTMVEKAKLNEPKEEETVDQKQQEYYQDKPKTTNLIAKYINVGGSYISKGILFGADVLHKGIKETGNLIEKHITKKNDITISESTKGTAKFIKTVSGKVIQFTTFAATTIINTSVKIGSMAVGAIIGKKDQPQKNESLQYLREIASASISATSSILENLDQAADKIGKQINESATTVVQKKYGDDAAELVNDGVQVVLDAGGAYRNIKSLGIKKVMKKTAQEAVKENI